MIKTNRLTVSAGALAIGLLCADVSGQGQSQGRGRGGSESSVSVVVVFRGGDQAVFRDYFVTHKITAQALPPGIAKKALPADLLRVAPSVDRDVSFAIVGEVVVALKGGVVIDVLAGVF